MRSPYLDLSLNADIGSNLNKSATLLGFGLGGVLVVGRAGMYIDRLQAGCRFRWPFHSLACSIISTKLIDMYISHESSLGICFAKTYRIE